MTSQLHPSRQDDTEDRNGPQIAARWLRVCLMLAGVHSVVWGLGIILFPAASSSVYGLAEPPMNVFLWQGTGLVLVLFGTGYLIASLDPWQHWAVVLVGLLAKLLGPVGMGIAVWRGEVSPNVLWLLPVNDGIWWIPFSLVVIQGVQQSGTRTRI